MKFLKVFFFVMLLSLCCGCASAEYTNLIQNPSFESGEYSSSGSPQNWSDVNSPSETLWVNNYTQSGSYAVYHNTTANTNRRGFTQNIFPSANSTSGNVSYYLKTDNITGTGGAGIYVMFYNGTTYLSAVTKASYAGTNNWTYHNESLPFPAGTTKVVLYTILNNCNGSAYWDDFCMYDNTMGDPVPETDLYAYDNFSDNFTDGDYSGWTVESGTISATDGYLKATSLSSGLAVISYPCNITHGTWVFKYEYPNGGFFPKDYDLSVRTDYLRDSDGNCLEFNNAYDEHWWLDYFMYPAWNRVVHAGYLAQMAGSNVDTATPQINTSSPGWHTVTFVLDENNYSRMYYDGKFVRWTGDIISDLNSSEDFVIKFADSTGTPLTYPIYVDDVEIYRDQYYYPSTNISYNTSLDAVVITSVDTSLADINSKIDNQSIFEYYSENNTATAHKNIILDEGANLKLINSTLLMDSASAGERKLIYYTDAGIYLQNSTIDTTRAYTFTFEKGSGKNPVYKNQLKVVNSTINNSVGLYLDRPTIFNITNSSLTNCDGISEIKFYFSPRDVILRNSTFTGYDQDAMIRFTGGEQFQAINPVHRGFDVIDCNFTGIQLSAIAGVHEYYMNILDPDCILNLRNTTLGQKTITKYRVQNITTVTIKYQNETVAEGANVTITNEQDNTYPIVTAATETTYSQLSSQEDESGIDYFKSTSQLNNYVKTEKYQGVLTYDIADSSGKIAEYLATTQNESENFTYTVSAELGDYSTSETGITFSEPITLYISPISANFTSNITNGMTNLTVQFNDTSVGNPTAWSWDFTGDSIEDSTEQNPVYTYTTAGTYNVSLTATNQAGNDTETKISYITVIARPSTASEWFWYIVSFRWW